MPSSIGLTTILAVLVFFLVSLNSFAQAPTGPPEDEPGKTAWIVTLKPGTSVDFRGLGARSVGSHGRHIFVQMPEGAARALARDPRVESLQKMVKALDAGEPARVDPEPQRGSGANAELPMESATTGTMNPSVVGDWSSGSYSYDGAGNIVSIGPNGDGKTDWYRYDGLGRLVEATANTATANNRETYEYDGFGNMTRKRTYADGATTPQADLQTSVNSGTNQVTTWTYHTAGSVTADTMHQFAWDPFRMLEQVFNGEDQYYIYTASDERIGTRIGSGEWWTWEVRDLSGRVVRQWSDWWGGWWEWERDYVYRDGAVLGGSTGRGKRHFHVDHLGTPRLITDATGTQISRHVYYPFGVEATSIQQEVVTGARIDDPAKFTGHERDFLSWGDGENVDYLDYMHARTYTPVGARFLSVDPAMDMDRAMRRPQGWNRYGYVENNPINMVDPDGRDLLSAGAGAVIGTVLGAVLEVHYQGWGWSQPVDYGRVGAATVGGLVTGTLSGACNCSAFIGGGGANIIGGWAQRKLNGEQQTVNALVKDGVAGTVGSKVGDGFGAKLNQGAIRKQVLKGAVARAESAAAATGLGADKAAVQAASGLKVAGIQAGNAVVSIVQPPVQDKIQKVVPCAGGATGCSQ